MNYLNKTKLIVLLCFLAVLLVLPACGHDAAEDAQETVTLTVSAAASLTDALEETGDVFHEAHPEIKVDFNFGGSGALQQQISQGAPADIFISASKSDFDALIDNGSINEEDSVNLLKNELVLVSPTDNQTVTSFDNVTKASQIAVGTPASVPAGKYALETFESMNITEEIEPLLVYAEDVRTVLTYVERGEVDAGLVYRTDALTSEAVEITESASEGSHEPIVYPLGMINSSENAEAAEKFYEFLQTEEALVIFEDYGFIRE